MAMVTPEQVFRAMVAAVGAGDRDAMRGLLADDVVAYVTNAAGSVDRVEGADAYVARVPDVSGADYSADVTQVVSVAPGQVLGMVEIKAERKGRTLHNHAAFLARVADERIAELWMVEALPAYSDEFWS
jgi:ketosteroid isomerase-like protein